MNCVLLLATCSLETCTQEIKKGCKEWNYIGFLLGLGCIAMNDGN